MYDIKSINLVWFPSYLTNGIQCISITHDLETDIKNICCRIPQGSILGPLLFLHNSLALDPIIFADNTNVSYEHKDLKTLFSLVNQELKKKLMNRLRQINSLLTLEKQYIPFAINQVEKMIFLSYYLGC